MVFVPPKETFPGKVYSVAAGAASKEIVFGGENSLRDHPVFRLIVNDKYGHCAAFQISDLAGC